MLRFVKINRSAAGDMDGDTETEDWSASEPASKPAVPGRPAGVGGAALAEILTPLSRESQSSIS